MPERKNRRQAVVPSEDEGALLSLSDSLRDGAAVIDAEGKIKGANKRFWEILGVAEHRTLGKRLDMVTAFRGNSVSAKLAELLSGQEVPPFELETRTGRRQALSLQVNLARVRRAADPPRGAVVIIRDITDQRRLQQKMLAVDERSRLFVDNADEGIVVVQGGKVVFISQRAADLMGRPIEEYLAKPFLESVHPADRRMVAGLHEKRVRGEAVPRPYSFRVARADGSIRWGEVSAVPHKWEGKPAFLCIVKDITERKRMEEELRESERRYRLLAENVSDVIWVTDMSLGATYLSPSIERLLGYPLAESLNHTVEGALTPASAEAVRRLLSGTPGREGEMSGTSGGLEVELKRVDGSTVWVESTVSFIPGPDGRPVEIMGVLRDITKRKLAEEALREAKAKLDLLMQQMPCLCWTTDRDLKFSSCAGALVSADRLERLMGTTVSEYYAAKGGEDCAPLSAHRRALAGTLDSYELEQNGRVFYCRVEPLRDAANELVGVVGAAVDLTDYKNLASQLQTLSRRLISVQEDERRAIASELHDQVGQSLTALKLLLEKAQATATGTESRQLAVAGGVVNDLMTRVREMSLDLRPAMLDDLGLLPTLLWHFKRYTAHTQVKVKFRHGGLRRLLPPDVSIAAYRIVQEALTNVARYARAKEVSVCVRAESGVVTVEVADHGVGFDEATLARQPSSGIRGMRERALALDGNFAVKSIPGRGTYVMAELPWKSAPKEGKEEEPRLP
jgi:PAS domain S-box-containing protein